MVVKVIIVQVQVIFIVVSTVVFAIATIAIATIIASIASSSIFDSIVAASILVFDLLGRVGYYFNRLFFDLDRQPVRVTVHILTSVFVCQLQDVSVELAAVYLPFVSCALDVLSGFSGTYR